MPEPAHGAKTDCVVAERPKALEYVLRADGKACEAIDHGIAAGYPKQWFCESVIIGHRFLGVGHVSLING